MQDISVYLENVNVITYIVVYVFGVITSFTPCTYPLIPIIVGVIGASGDVSKVRKAFLSVVYVLGMAITFSILGMVAALSGRLFGQFQVSPLANIVLGGVIILFALSLLDVIVLPTYFLNRLGAGKASKGKSASSIFMMGLASGLIAAPCATAVLGALLAFVSTTQNVVVGSTLLFTYALGFGTLIILVGTFTGVVTTLSKSKKIMGIVNKVLAFIMIILGCYYIFKAGTLSI
jgi:thiol:disulfide interchange protein